MFLFLWHLCPCKLGCHYTTKTHQKRQQRQQLSTLWETYSDSNGNKWPRNWTLATRPQTSMVDLSNMIHKLLQIILPGSDCIRDSYNMELPNNKLHSSTELGYYSSMYIVQGVSADVASHRFDRMWYGLRSKTVADKKYFWANWRSYTFQCYVHKDTTGDTTKADILGVLIAALVQTTN